MYFFRPIVEKLKDDQDIGQTIIFYRTYDEGIVVQQYFLVFWVPQYLKGSPNYLVHKVVDMYTHCAHKIVKD